MNMVRIGKGSFVGKEIRGVHSNPTTQINLTRTVGLGWVGLTFRVCLGLFF